MDVYSKRVSIFDVFFIIYLKYLLTADFANIFHDDLLLTLAISCIVLYFLIVHIYLYPDSIQEALAHTNTALKVSKFQNEFMKSSFLPKLKK